ncbi:MAG TPA: tetratricopeptide repeat protein [Thermoguttaceae bacterium]|nr:tetratricopeptide repeat protein [Thermoguttaceae bacterium]
MKYNAQKGSELFFEPSATRRIAVLLKNSSDPFFFVVAMVAVSLCGCGGLAARGLNAEGVRKFERAQYEQSLAQFQQAVQNDPNSADAYYNLGAVYHRMGTLNCRPPDLEQAERYYNQCLDHDADHAECYRGLSVLLAEQGRTEEAFRLLEGWADRRGDLAEPKIELARLREETGNLAAAKERLVEALAIDPNHPRALSALGNLQEKAGEQSQALANYQRSLWHDRFQPQVAARIASLQAGLPTTVTGVAPVTVPPGAATQTATRANGLLR